MGTMNGQVPLILRFIWFIAIGLWLGGLMTTAAWLCCVSVIGLPIGLWLFNQLPTVMTLKQPEIESHVVMRDGMYLVQHTSADAPPLLFRLLYLVLIGWWASLIWITLAFAISASIVLSPIAFWMFNRVPTVVWLAT